MKFNRVLLLHDVRAGRAPAEALVKRIAPAAEVRIVEVAADRLAMFGGGDLAALAASAGIDLVLADHLALSDVPLIAELRKRSGVAVLWNDGGTPDDRTETLQVRCVAVGARANAAIAAFLREHADASMRAKVGAAIPPTGSETIDLIVVPHLPGALLPVIALRAPVLVLPPITPVAPLVREIDAPDAIDDGGVLRTTLRYAAGVGRREPIPDQTLEFFSRGVAIAKAESHDGAVELSVTDAKEPIAIRRMSEEHPEVEIDVIRPGAKPLVLYDAAMPNADLARLAASAASRHFEVLSVRLRPLQSCRWIRARLMRAMLPPVVVDASAVLDEGSALDVGMNVDAVRLARVAGRMRAAGFPVCAIVHCSALPPQTNGFAALRASELQTASIESPLVAPRRSLAERLDDSTATQTIPGNRIELEIDNAKARRWLLDAIAAATHRIHLQLYMAADDDIGRMVEAGLAAAAARGVTVRVVVDSLHAFEGSFGLHNPLLQRLAAHTGVELRAGRPILGPPSIEEFKQRDHRKLAVFDGTLALLGGRNLSHEYYSGFDEIPLTTTSQWREVPWLDAGARVEGPAVAALERSFLDAWTAAGGAPFDIDERPEAGNVNVRVVTHHGLRDARTLEAYVAMIDSAQSHLHLVNGFPLILEIQHALLRALKRGIRVRTLFGNLTPTHAGKPFDGAWSSARAEATNLVRSRMDVLALAGAEAYELMIPRRPAWSAEVGDVRPHVHAKLASVDGRICSVGSANLDVTAGYWESELMLIVEDESIAAGIEKRIDGFIASSMRIDTNDAQWKEAARRRQWMRYWPGVLSI